jgi:hypothetical protein
MRRPRRDSIVGQRQRRGAGPTFYLPSYSGRESASNTHIPLPIACPLSALEPSPTLRLRSDLGVDLDDSLIVRRHDIPSSISD